MGNSCQQIKQNCYKKNSNILLNIKLPKLRDYFASYKSICDNFSIDLLQFQHIFGVGQSSFVIWDTDNNGLIDALQLFSGIAVFSDTKLQDKIRFLFDVFDFNEVQYLEHIELQFLIYCSINATFKIFGINNQVVNEEIQDFVRQLFFQVPKITVANLIQKSKINKNIQQFFDIIKGQSYAQKKSNQKIQI